VRRWLVVIAIAIVLLSALGVSEEATRFPQLSAPSPRNPGPGGLTKFVSILESKGYLVIEPSTLKRALEDLSSYHPSASAMIVTGFSSSDYRYVEELKRWVAKGGLLVVMDEFSDAKPVLKTFGVDMAATVVGVASASCVGNATITLDVYSFLRGGRELCTISSSPVAVEVRVGNGSVIAIGDSSLAINYLSSYPRIFHRNTAFLLKMLSHRHVVAVYFPTSLESFTLGTARAADIAWSLLRFSSKLLTSTPLATALTVFFVVSVSALLACSRITGRRRRSSLEREIYEAKRELNTVLEALRSEGREVGGES